MAGSFNHILGDDGKFTFDTIENMGDACECAEECFWLINHLSGGSIAKVRDAEKQMYRQFRGEEPSQNAMK